jgi:nucleotide-binding universal stress UspA family protein
MSATRATLATSSKEISRLVARQGEQNGIVLAPIDFSGHSRAALVQAGRYAQMMDASLVALHVVHDPGEMPGYYSKLIKKKRATRIPDIAADAFDDFMADIVRENPHIPALQSARRLMVTGLPVTRILELVDFLEPAMVVMGSQGRTGLKNLVIGSKAAQIVQLCPVPVTIVKKQRAPKRG